MCSHLQLDTIKIRWSTNVFGIDGEQYVSMREEEPTCRATEGLRHFSMAKAKCRYLMKSSANLKAREKLNAEQKGPILQTCFIIVPYIYLLACSGSFLSYHQFFSISESEFQCFTL